MDPTERVSLGRTGVMVTRLGLGSAPLAGGAYGVPDQSCLAAVERAHALGLRLFDTAPLYGYGNAEWFMGSVLSGKPRDEFTLSTKVGWLLRSDGRPVKDQLPHQQTDGSAPTIDFVFDFSRDGIRTSLEESLQRLGMERVDIAYLHDPDDHHEEALATAFPALDQLRREGMIRAVGAGMNQAEMPARFAQEVDVDCFLLAGRYTLLDQIGLQELLPLCVEKQISIVAGGVYNSGVLANPNPGATYNYAPAPQDILRRAQDLDTVCRRHDVPLKAAAIQFPVGHPAVACVVIGAQSAEEVDENVAMFRYPIADDLWQDLKAEGLLPPDAPVPAGP